MRRGALLLEVLVALAIVVGVGAFSLRAVSDAQSAMERADQRRRCNDAAVAVVRLAQAGMVGIGDLRSESLPELLEQSVFAGEADAVELVVETEQTVEPGLMLLIVSVKEREGDVFSTVRCLVHSDLRIDEIVR